MSTIRWFDHEKTYAKRLQVFFERCGLWGADKLGYADANPAYQGWFNKQGELMAGVWAYQQLGNLVKPVLAKVKSSRLG